MLLSVSRALTTITNRRLWDAPKSGQVFHFICGRHFGPSGVQGVTPSLSASLPWHWIGGGGGAQMDSPDKMRREGEWCRDEGSRIYELVNTSGTGESRRSNARFVPQMR